MPEVSDTALHWKRTSPLVAKVELVVGRRGVGASTVRSPLASASSVIFATNGRLPTVAGSLFSRTTPAVVGKSNTATPASAIVLVPRYASFAPTVSIGVQSEPPP